jgi:hypothetical protein
MGNYGIKIVKDGFPLTTTNVNDCIFWSKYPGLMLVDTVDITFSLEGDTSGSEVYSHGLDYTPFVLGKYHSCSFTGTISADGEVLPVQFSGPVNDSTVTAYDPDEDVSFEPIFASISLGFDIDDTNITINWYASAFQGGGGYSGYFTNWTGGDITATVKLSIYTFDIEGQIE